MLTNLTQEHKEQLDALIEETIIPAINEDLQIFEDEDEDEDKSAIFQNNALIYLIEKLKTKIL